jgi:serine/threonine-protein kinase RsbW
MKSIKISIPSLIENIQVIESFIDNAKESFEINALAAGAPRPVSA